MKLKTIIVIALTLLFMTSGISMTATSIKVEKNNTLSTDSNTYKAEEIEFYALIIGVETFAGGNMYPLEDKIDDDAVSMYNLLLNSSNWKEQNMKLLLNENATKDKIKDEIENWLGGLADENDIVLIYYASHGWKLKLRQRKYGHAMILTYNETDEHRLKDRITDKEFDSYVDKIKSKHIAIILGSCYSGRMLALRQKGRVLLAAGGKHFFCGVDEDDSLGGGIFTHFIKQGLEGVADLNNDGWVTAEEAFRYAKLPTIHFSIWKQFPFVQKWRNATVNQTIIWFFQVPTMYDRHFRSIPLYQYQEGTDIESLELE